MKYKCELDPDVVLDEKEVYDHAATELTFEDIGEQIDIKVTKDEIIEELARFESPLFYTLYNAALAKYIKNFYYEIDDEEDED